MAKLYIYIYMLIKSSKSLIRNRIVNLTYLRFNPSNDKDVFESTSDKAKWYSNNKRLDDKREIPR